MTDRYDPKVSVRPMPDRKGSDPRQESAEHDDPLFELARIVSGRGAGAVPPAPPPRGQPAPAPAPERARPPASEPDVLGDLEAELLSDLQASFAAVKESIEAPREPPVQPAAPPASKAPPAPQAAAAPPPSPRPAPFFEPARQPQAEATASEQHASRPQAGSPQQHAAQQHAAPPPQPQPAHPRVSAAARPPLQQVPQRQQSAQSAPAVAPPREHPQAPPPASTEPADLRNVEIANFNMRPTTAPTVRVTAAPPRPAEKPAPAAAKPSRWDKPAEPPKPHAGAPSRFAPPRAANPAQPPAQTVPPPLADDEEELPFGEGVPFVNEGEAATDEFPLDAFDIVPGYGDDTEVPPYPDDELEPLRKRGVPRSLVVVAGILALVLIGVLAVVMLRPNGGAGGTPPIIAADAGPTKIAPPEAPAASDGDQQNKLIYDRVDSASGNAPADTKLVTPGNEPIAPVPQTDNNNNPIARVIMPGGPAPEAPGTADAGNPNNAGTDIGGANLATNQADGAQSIGPRKVRTVVVRPDGTIVSSDAVPAPGDAPASVDATPAPSTAQVPAVPPLPTNDDTAAIAGGKSGQELPITADAGAPASPADTAANQPETPAPAPAAAQAQIPTPTPTPPRAKPAPPKVVATGGDRGPIDLTPGTPATQVASAAPAGQGAATPVAAGGMMVQISSQRTEDAAQATFRDLQARYSSVLGRYQANIQKADLGDRGTYYRVRVGPFAAADAQTVCGALKNAGGDCVLSAH